MLNSACGVTLPGLRYDPPMTTNLLSSDGSCGKTFRAIAIFVSGPVATRTISPGRWRASRMIAAGPRSCPSGAVDVRELSVAEAVQPVVMRCVAMGPDKRTGCALVDRNRRRADQPEDAARVLGRVDDVDIAGQGRDGNQIDIGSADGQPNGKGVIHASIDVEDKRSRICHVVSFWRDGADFRTGASISTQTARFLTAK